MNKKGKIKKEKRKLWDSGVFDFFRQSPTPEKLVQELLSAHCGHVPQCYHRNTFLIL